VQVTGAITGAVAGTRDSNISWVISIAHTSRDLLDLKLEMRKIDVRR